MSRMNKMFPKREFIFYFLFLILFSPWEVFGARINPTSDLQYLGAFRLPYDYSNGTTWEYSESGMTFRKNGDTNGPNDGFPGSLFGIGHVYHGKVSEFNIPAPSKSKNVSSLPRAQALQTFQDISGGLVNGGLTGTRVSDVEYVYEDNKEYLYWTLFTDYDPEYNQLTFGRSSINLGNPQPSGMWRIDGENSATTSRYMFQFPQNWANENVGARTLAVGRMRMWNGQGTWGPALYAIAPWEYGNPPTNGTALDGKKLLYFPRDFHLKDYSTGDKWIDGEWIENNNKSAVIISGTKGFKTMESDPPYSYGETPPDGCGYHGYHAEPYYGALLFFDPEDLAKVARGDMEPYAVEPYAYLNLQPYSIYTEGCRRFILGGVAYDTDHHLLYIQELRADGAAPVIHVFSVTDAGRSPDTQPPTTPSHVYVTNRSSDQIEISWNAATDNSGKVVYVVYRNDAPIAITVSTLFTDKNISYFETHKYKIEARDLIQNKSANSCELNADNSDSCSSSNEPPSPTPLGSVDDLSLTGASDKFLSLKWSPVNDDRVTGYKLYFGETVDNFSHDIDLGTPSISNGYMTANINLSELTLGESYHFVMVSYDQNYNESQYSNEVSWTYDDNNPEQYSHIITVSSVNELQNAVSNLSSDTQILIADGEYNLEQSLIISGNIEHCAIKGASGNREAVIIKGKGMTNSNFGNAAFGIVIRDARDVLISDLTIQDFYYHDIMIKSEDSASQPILRNLHLKDSGEQLIKVTAAPNQSSYCDNGLIEYCLIEYTDRANSYINALSALAVKDWMVRDNIFRNIRGPEGQLAGAAILFWQNSIGTIVERNKIINCDIGIAFGNSVGPRSYARDGETVYDHQGGIIRNNFIFCDQPGDVGISVNKANDFKILNNTVILQNTFLWTIEYRFSSSNGLVANNLTDGNILARDSAQATLTTNITNAQDSWFKDISNGDLHITAQATPVIDHGTASSDVIYDIDGQQRTGIPDIGADESTDNNNGGDITPPGDVTGFTATAGLGQVSLSWTNPPDTDFAGVMIRYNTDGTYPQNKYDGSAIPNGNDGKISGSPSQNMSYVHTNLDPTKHYYYSAFTYDTSNNYSQTAHADAQPLPSPGHDPVIESFTADPTTLNNPGETTTFNVSATDPDSDSLTYTVNFGDGTANGSGSQVEHTYEAEGTYTAEVTVDDGNGNTVVKSLQITVDDVPPTKPTGVTAN